MDYSLEQLINAPAGHQPLLDGVMVILAAWSEPFFIAVVAAWFLLGLIWRRGGERRGALVALLAAGLALLFNQVLGHLWDRPRPFVAHAGQVHLLLPHAADSSFPSDHAAAAFAIALVVIAFHRRSGFALIVTALLVAFARVYVGDHYPTDVLAGAAVGLLAGGALIRFAGIGSAAAAALDAGLIRVRLLPHREPSATGP